MKKTLTAALAALLILPALSAGARGYSPLPPELDGTMMPYDFAAEKRVAVPDSLTPFHIVYVGRHGARYLSSEKKVTGLEKTLKEYASRGLLTHHGEEFMQFLAAVAKASDGRWGALSSVGQREQVELAREMMEQYPDVFTSGKVVAHSSDIWRVVNTMYSFTSTLSRLNPDLEIYTSSGPQNSPLMRFFDVDREYYDWLHPKGEAKEAADSWEEPLERFEVENAPVGPAARLIRNNPGKRELQKISMQMYNVLQGMRSSALPAPTEQWMSADEYRACWACKNAEQYFKRSLTSFSTIPLQAATPLLIAMIADADSAITAPVTPDMERALLYFGHAETLLPLAALMDIPQSVALPLDNDAISDEWKNYEITPMGANISVTLARSESGDVYSSVALNGRDGAWTPWPEQRALWLERIARISGTPGL